MNQPSHRSWVGRFFSPASAPTLSGTGGDAVTPELTNNQGALFASGASAPPDYARAMECFRKAAENGYAPAQSNMGMMFAFGQGVSRNEQEACRWFRRAAEQGDAGGQFHLGNMCHPASLGQLVPETVEARIQAYMWFSLAAAQGYHKAEASRETLNLQMTNAELEEGNRRTAAFVSRPEIKREVKQGG